MKYSLNRTKYLLPDEIAELKRVCEPALNRDCLLILLALHTGARASELLRITISDISTTNQSVYIHGLKGSNDREIPLPEWLWNALQRYMQTCVTPRLFSISYSRLKQVWNFHRPTSKKFHSLRHTFAIELYKRTKDLRLVQVALGHRNITNTMIYADYIYSQTELRRLIL
jgi:integrase